jgi:hypothetical protein
MIRVRQVLAALLFSLPAGAQVARWTPAEPTPAAPAALAAPALGAALASPALLAPALTPALSAAPSLPRAPALSAGPLSAPAAAGAPALVPAAAEPASAAAAADGGRKRPAAAATPAATPAAAPGEFGRLLFDGSVEMRTRSGAVFVPSFSDEARQFQGGFAFVLARPSPAARLKSIPNTQGLSGEALLDRVGSIAARGQRYNIYRAASKFLFSTADNHSLNRLQGVTDAYSGVFIPGTSADARDYSESEDAAHDGWPRPQVMNVEHVFPQSFFKSLIPMRSDLHHLMATLEHPNNVRSNLPFGVVKEAPDYHNDAGAKRGGGVFEPPDFTKGRVARAMLYFYARYRREEFFNEHAAQFWNSQIAVLLDWNRRFPPSVEERRRNDQVERFQGNRNPFVDDPSLADKIGPDAWRAPLPRATRAASAEAPSRRSDKPRKGGRREGKPNRVHNRGRGFRR